MITPFILGVRVGADLLDGGHAVIRRVSSDTLEVRSPHQHVLDIAKSRAKRAGFHVYGVPDAGTVHRFRVREKGAR